MGMAEDIRAAFDTFRRPGESDTAGSALWRTGRVALTVLIVSINLVGAVAVFLLAVFALPLPYQRDVEHVRMVNGIAAVIYVAVAVPIGAVVGVRNMVRLREWLVEDRPAGRAEQRAVLRAPLRLFVVQMALWSGAAIVFAVLDRTSPQWSWAAIMATIVLTGMVTASCAYLVTERVLRGIAARALASGPPEKLAVPGVATRAVLAWALGSGIPVGGLVGIGVLALAGVGDTDRIHLAVSMISLGGVGIAVGLLAVTLVARATVVPVEGVRRALARVQQGDLDVSLPIYDGTQLGQLQLGFNRMVAGLNERELIRRTFGTYVDPDVAAHILAEGAHLDGEEVEVTLMFLDVRSFTSFAERNSATDVVAALNRLFETTVPVIHAHGGRVDKFIGDGLLAVFGAPVRLPDHADCALAAALAVASAVAAADGLKVGIGLNSGTVVAGNVGAPGRLEFSVIGDAVNVAARVEAATRVTGDAVLITGQTAALLRGTEVDLEERFDVELKGKAETVRLFAPTGRH